jgi:hypothetical protein
MSSVGIGDVESWESGKNVERLFEYEDITKNAQGGINGM